MAKSTASKARGIYGEDTSCCIRDLCGKPFDTSIREERSIHTLRPFWWMYCSEHRVTGKRYEPIVCKEA